MHRPFVNVGLRAVNVGLRAVVNVVNVGLRVLVNVGLRAMNVGLRAVVNVVNVGLRALVNVGLRAVIFCRFWKPPCTGEVLPKFSTYSVVFLVLQSRTYRRGPIVPRRPRSSSSVLRSCLHSITSPLPR